MGGDAVAAVVALANFESALVVCLETFAAKG